MRRYLDGHIGELILLAAFLAALITFGIVYALTKQESTLLGGIVMGALTSLGTYMQKRASTTTNVDTANIDKIENKSNESQ
jgi:ABC-type Fe3+-siderophore transport system permease subunit